MIRDIIKYGETEITYKNNLENIKTCVKKQ